MHEFLKQMCWLVLIVGIPLSIVFRVVETPLPVDFFQNAVPFFAVSAGCGLVLLATRRDRVPDYLGAKIPKPFRRGGVTFGIVPSVRDGVYTLEIGFQNERDSPCVATFALRSVQDPLDRTALIDLVVISVEIPPAGFGVTRIPLVIPKLLRGKTAEIQIGVTVRRPIGHGRRVRFRGGIAVRNTAHFRVDWTSYFMAFLRIALIVAVSMVTCGIMFFPLFVLLGTVTFETRISTFLPRDCVTDLDEAALEPTTAILWQLGDPPL